MIYSSVVILFSSYAGATPPRRWLGRMTGGSQNLDEDEAEFAAVLSRPPHVLAAFAVLAGSLPCAVVFGGDGTHGGEGGGDVVHLDGDDLVVADAAGDC